MTAPLPAPGLSYSFSVLALTTEPQPIERRDHESLEFIPITGGTVSGALTGVVLPGGGDWALTRADESFRVEARYQFRTSNDELVDVYNVGFLRHLEGDSGPEADMGYFLTTPVFRTVAPALQWLTRSVFVGRAHLTTEGTALDFFEAVS